MFLSMESINHILETIRPNRSALFGFFSMMPKGGDLHHHYSGSIYAESYIDYVFYKDYYINEETLEIAKDISGIPDNAKSDWKLLSKLPIKDRDKVKLKLLRQWSTKDFVKGERSSDEHFFSTFPGFNIASKENFAEGLRELKARAVNQRLSYLETIFISANTKDINLPNEAELDAKFLGYQKQKNEVALFSELEAIFSSQSAALKKIADSHTKLVEQFHAESQVESGTGEEPGAEEVFVLRFQNYVARYKQPVDVFIDLCVCFYSCDSSRLISGVNIVGAENSEVAMRDYWLHTMYFKFLEEKFPRVRYAIHAGELVGGMVQPEKLGTHIKQSLVLENLRRIGHAVDIIYDRDFSDTIEKIQKKNLAIEINLTSNEFILGVANDLHPVEIYFTNGIPVVICTDDEGVLRTSISEQYVLLAHRYKLSYTEIRQIVRNSIVYSHLEDDTIKQRLLAKLDQDFAAFERGVLHRFKVLVTQPTPIGTHAQPADRSDLLRELPGEAVAGRLEASLAPSGGLSSGIKFRSISTLYRG